MFTAREGQLVASRTAAFFKTFFTGVVAKLSGEVIARRRANWSALSKDERIAFLEKLEKKLTERRASMAETAARVNTVGVIDALILGLGGVGAFAADSKSPVKWVLTIAISLIALSACTHRWAIAAKLKVWKKPRKGGFSEPDEMLQQAVDVKAISTSSGEISEADLDERFQKLHARKIVLVVERRAQNLAVWMANVGTLLVPVGLLLRLIL